MNVMKNQRGWFESIVCGVVGLMGLGMAGDVIDLSDAPDGGLNLDEIFGENQGAQTTVAQVTNDPPPAVVATTQTTEPVIKTKTGTVYKSIGDAVEGIEHKDALIAQLREQVRQNTGRDPLTVNRPAANQPVDYTQDQEKYFADIASAVEKHDTKAYMAAQQKLIYDSLGFLTPTITNLSKANAERVVSEQMPEFKGFLATDQYKDLATESPLLADAIRSAESNPAAAAQLPELYRIAYLSSQGRRVPELIQSAQENKTQVQPRPTVQSTQLAPPPTTGTPVAQPGLDTTAGRKALIEKMEQGGISNLKW